VGGIQKEILEGCLRLQRICQGQELAEINKTVVETAKNFIVDVGKATLSCS
jgi:hypothetical protein